MAFGGVEVLKGVSVRLQPGEVHGIVGENGAGKSTLAKLIAGVHQPTGGRIEIDGQADTLPNPKSAIKRGIALIHQEPLSFPDLDVAENIFVGRLPMAGGRVDWRSMYDQASEILRTLGVKINPRAKLRGMSVADQQMVELAAALSQDAQVLLMDETTAPLTPKETAELFGIVRRLKEQGKAIAFVSHHLDEVFEICDRITVLRDGEHVGEVIPSQSSVDEVVRLMIGRTLEKDLHADLPAVPPGKPVLQVEGLTVHGRFRDVGFDLRPGEILGVAGLVGAGRTDVARALFGITKPDGGSILIGGESVRFRSPAEAMRHGLVMVPEDRQHHGLLLPMTISQNATLAVLRDLSKLGWMSERRQRRDSEEIVGRMNIAMRDVGQVVRELSGGNQQKVVLAKWLMSRPKILILDEPTRGVDVGAKAQVHALIRELAAGGMAILMISSDLPEVLAMSDRILVMREGRIAATLERGVDSEAVMRAATGQVANA
jgi:rhamnose transport system ATP-binding protein